MGKEMKQNICSLIFYSLVAPAQMSYSICMCTSDMYTYKY